MSIQLYLALVAVVVIICSVAVAVHRLPGVRRQRAARMQRDKALAAARLDLLENQLL